jgi:outer membrane protein TolC
MAEKLKLLTKMALILLVCSSSAKAQQALTLKECINYSNSNNSNIKMANYDVAVSEQKIVEQRGNYLPQLNGSGSLDVNLRLATQLLPAEFLGGTPGTYIPVTFGTKYNMSAGLQLTQKLYDPASFIGIKTAGVSKKLSEQTLMKTNEQTVYNISVIYYQTLVIQKQLETLKSTMKASEQSLKSIELKYANGASRKVDVDKIRVNYNNTRSQLQQTELNYAQSLNTLKYQMGMPVDSALALADTSLSTNYETFDNGVASLKLDNLIDYQMKQTNLTLSELEKKRSLAAYHPSLSFYGNYNFNAMRKEFTFFQSGYDWFQSSSVGLKLAVPIFSGFQRNSRLSQSKLNLLKAEESMKLAEQAIKVDVSNYEIKYRNALANIRSEKENLDLAESVYKNTQLEYQQGACNTLDLIQAESSYMVAQNSYYNKLLNLYIARIDQEKAKGNLINFVNNQKF